MSHLSASFDGLPPEIITNIFEVMLEDQCREHCFQGAELTELPESFSGHSLLAPIHISSKIRAIILGHSAIWRLITTKVIASLGSRSHLQSVELPSFCASQTGHTLRDVDLERFDDTNSSCAQQLQELVQIVAFSSHSLERLQLPEFPKDGLTACQCSSCCMTTPAAAIESVWTAILDVLAKAKALHRLTMDVPADLDFSRITSVAALANDFATQPRELKFRVLEGHEVSTTFIKMMTQLSCQLHRLCLWIDGDMATDLWDIDRLVSSVTQAGYTTLRSLTLLGEIDGSTIINLFESEWPFLEELCVGLDIASLMGSPSLSSKRHISSLRRLKVPAWLLASFETPQLERAVLALTSASEEALVLQNLRHWRSLNRLVLYPQLPSIDANAASLMIRNILRALTPAKGQLYACPELSELGITTALVSFEGWMTSGEVWLDEEATRPRPWQKPGYLEVTPVIGSDLFKLDRRRRHLWTLDRSFPSTSTLAQDGQCPYWPLRVIRILGCLVQSTVWESVLSEVLSPDERHCSPDPSKVLKSLRKDDKQNLLPDLLAAYQRLKDEP